jgi:hypothetical protein
MARQSRGPTLAMGSSNFDLKLDFTDILVIAAARKRCANVSGIRETRACGYAVALLRLTHHLPTACKGSCGKEQIKMVAYPGFEVRQEKLMMSSG